MLEKSPETNVKYFRLLEMEKILVIFLLALNVHYSQQRCVIGAGWKTLTMGERLSAANSVVYGRTVQHLSGTQTMFGRTRSVIDALFEVYCILKSGDENFEQIIRIEGIAPRDGCSGSKGNMQIGQEAFLALRPTVEGNYEFDEIMPTQSAVFKATKSNFLEISSFCGLQTWLPPINATNDMCPVCGVANFTNSVMETDAGSSSPPCIVNGELVSNTTDCDMILTGDTAVDETCISSTFADTCTRLIYSFNDVSCACTYNVVDQDSYQDVSAGYQGSPSVFTLGTLFLMALKI